MDLDTDETRASLGNCARRARDFINAIHDLDGSRCDKIAFRHQRCAQARDLVEQAMGMLQDAFADER